MLSQRNSGQSNIILISNNQNQNNPMNTQNSNYSNNNYSSQNEPSQPQSKETSINNRKDIVSNSSSFRGGDSTSASNALGQKFNKQKRKSSNKSEILNNNNINENLENENNNNKDENGNNNNNYNLGLEPIMEVPPLTKIEKKPYI